MKINEIMNESASVGGTASGAIATVPGGGPTITRGASIYGKKKKKKTNEDYASNFDMLVNEVIGLIRNEIRDYPEDDPQVVIATILEELEAKVREELKDWDKNTVINH